MPTTATTPSPANGRRADETSEARIAKALAHPLRARILQRLGERVTSPGDLALELGAPLGVVSYHVRMLREYDCVELVRTEPRRGALQHFYRATARPSLEPEQWRSLPATLRRELSGATVGQLLEDLGAAADAGALDDPEVITTRMPLELDERGFRKLNKLLAKTLEQATQIATESAERTAENPDSRVATELAVLHFKRAELEPSNGTH
jgi:DNA-binding transcriptional ArsR family regulator